MATTVWLDRPTHARLLELKQKRGLTSLGAVIRSLLDEPVESAQAIYQRQKTEVNAVCEKYGVTRLVAFGSRARGDARPDSDLDVAVEAPRGIGLGIVSLFEELEQALAIPTDVIEYPSPTGRMYAEVQRDGVELFAR